jgi:hypothetical protein
MRNAPRPAWAAGLLLALAAPAPAREEPRAVVERAVAAHGGQDRLARVRADKVKVRGKFFVGGRETEFTAETTVQLPAQFKNVMHFTADGKEHTLVQVLNGDDGFVTLDGQPQKLPPAALAEMRETMQVDRAVRLVPLLSDPAFTLAALGEAKAGDRPAVGVKVTARGRKELRLYFDKETALLVKTEHVLDDGQGKEVRQEEFYGDFRDLGGYRRPVRVTAFRDGKKIMEAELTDAKYLDRVDEAEFAKP